MSDLRAKNWIDLEDWGKGMGGFKLPSSDELSGKELEFHFNAGNPIFRYTFLNANSLAWQVLEDSDKRQSYTESYEAIRVAPGIYFVDFIKKNKPSISISMALDLNTRKATVLTVIAPNRKKVSQSLVDRLGRGVDLSTMKVEIMHANINPSSPDESVIPHQRTLDLIGKRIKYTYSRNHIYEHIYLNDRLFTWHCLVGVEKGLADTEFCDYFKIAPDVYLFTWREKIMPTFGVVIINLKEMRSNGKTFGLDVATGKYVNFTMGSYAEYLNNTINQ
jgi:hypothetical protein